MHRTLIFFIRLYEELFWTMLQLMRGIWHINRLPRPIVTIFGGTRAHQTSPYALQAHELAQLLGEHDISIITGGGPGIMQAATCGASHVVHKDNLIYSIGIMVRGLDRDWLEESPVMLSKENITVEYFFARKWLMVNYSVAFAVFPGGFGTLNELGEVLTLMQTKKLSGVPVILIGKKYWEPLITWFHDTVLKEGMISQQEFDLLFVTDDIYEALEYIKKRCEACGL